MDTIRPMTLSAQGNSCPHPQSGANLSKMKLRYEQQSITQLSMPSAETAAHVVRQFGATSGVALLALGGMFIACEAAGVSNPVAFVLAQSPAQAANPSQDNPAQDDEKKSDTKDDQKPAINRDVKNIAPNTTTKITPQIARINVCRS